MSESLKLYYVYDPMCSWCWGYRPIWKTVEQALSDKVEIIYVPGGLAPDTDEPMPQPMQTQIASYWRKIETYLGTEFNYEFWTRNTPRRSTYPACRAVIAARTQGREKEMLHAIQRAYYLEARNPSEDETLLALAKETGLDSKEFSDEFFSSEIREKLIAEIHFARSLGGNHFPSLFLKSQSGVTELQVDYKDATTTINAVLEHLKS